MQGYLKTHCDINEKEIKNIKIKEVKELPEYVWSSNESKRYYTYCNGINEMR